MAARVFCPLASDRSVWLFADVVATIQYPYLILMNALVPAILAGNTVILKPSPQTPTVAEHASKIFGEAGLPQGVIQYFHCGSPTIMETVVRDPRIALVCFTGSVAGGLAVQKAAADRVVQVGLELGGKDPAYVRADVDLNWAAEEIVDGAIFNSGQSCCSLERVYVDEQVHDAFVEAVQKVLKGYKLGDPFDKETQIGPVISKRAKEAIEAHIKNALDNGAKDATPENNSFSNPPSKGNFVKPTLLTGVDHSMTVMTEETFGPVIPIMKVKGDKEAIQLMNDSEFGLTASIWTKDTDKGYELAEDVEAGTVFVNRADYPSPVSYFLMPRFYTDRVLIFPITWSYPMANLCNPPKLGFGLDGVEKLRKRPNFGQIWLRAIRQVEELSRQRLPKIGYGSPRISQRSE